MQKQFTANADANVQNAHKKNIYTRLRWITVLFN